MMVFIRQGMALHGTIELPRCSFALLWQHARLCLIKHATQKHRTMQTTSIATQEGPP
jgi:hypothetical protein